MSPAIGSIKILKSELAEIGKDFARRSWSLATSSNYSCKLDANRYLITRSGIDKSQMTENDLVEIDGDGKALRADSAKTSAETLIHTCIYQSLPNVGAVLHTHSVFGTRLSLNFESEGKIVLSGYEMLKGLSGNQNHKDTEVIPVLPNSQDMTEFSKKLKPILLDQSGLHGFLIAGHGLYTWGRDLSETKRHVECFEFLFQCLAYEKLGF